MAKIHQVLLAEDDYEEYIQFVKAINSISEEVQVMRLDDGYNTLTMLQTSISPDAIFLDINMPYKNGLMTLDEIRRMDRFRTVPIIICSKNSYQPNVDIAYELGATFYVQKGVPAEKLEKMLRNIFSSSWFTNRIQPPKEKFQVMC
jgi:CheY-like chemotaxis protein